MFYHILFKYLDPDATSAVGLVRGFTIIIIWGRRERRRKSFNFFVCQIWGRVEHR